MSNESHPALCYNHRYMFGKWKSSSQIALIALVGVTAVWGWTFLVVQNAISRTPVMDFLAVRFTIASVVMLVLRPRWLLGISRRGLWRGSLLGVVLGLGYIAQTFGLLSASAAVSGFITGMFVVLTPITAWIILRHKTSRSTLLAVVLACVGLGLLSLHGWSLGIGETLTLACAFFFALHIVGLGEWSSQYNPYGFTLIQISIVALISLVAAAPGGIEMPPDSAAWIAVGITSVLATALAFLVQTWAQSLVSPTRAAVIMTMEPVFAGIFAVVIGGNQLTARIIAGAACVLAAMLVIQLTPHSRPVLTKPEKS
jgi:drug/metabolite transporter (DMT)-like permease